MGIFGKIFTSNKNNKPKIRETGVEKTLPRDGIIVEINDNYGKPHSAEITRAYEYSNPNFDSIKAVHINLQGVAKGRKINASWSDLQKALSAMDSKNWQGVFDSASHPNLDSGPIACISSFVDAGRWVFADKNADFISERNHLLVCEASESVRISKKFKECAALVEVFKKDRRQDTEITRAQVPRLTVLVNTLTGLREDVAVNRAMLKDRRDYLEDGFKGEVIEGYIARYDKMEQDILDLKKRLPPIFTA